MKNKPDIYTMGLSESAPLLVRIALRFCRTRSYDIVKRRHVLTVYYKTLFGAHYFTTADVNVIGAHYFKTLKVKANLDERSQQ